ncbi:LRR amino-terminal domain protein [Medicago truncatula]|uniref:LRR amino-terminal domain protein n=1 Tax=Medicago truncatula TaxID=3880 RepID=A0A072U670_MEDTR|nr:LRR amino-terminal domain protein [Medicago truncatula]
MKQFNFLFCVVSILCISLVCAENFHLKKCVETERRALLGFVWEYGGEGFGKKEGASERNRRHWEEKALKSFPPFPSKLPNKALRFKEAGNGSLSSWKGEECCKWKGISCDNLTGYVTSLNFQTLGYTKGLQGKLDSSICELQYLTSINLNSNNLHGKIPKCIGTLGQLIELNLGFNGLEGKIPKSVGSLGNLIELNLSGNKLVSVIPPGLGNLSNLQTLDLGFNDLTANDLEWISHLSNLRHLGLSKQNSLNGLGYNYDMISNDLEWLSHLSNLRCLDLSFVNLTLAVDRLSSISKTSSLSELHLLGCGLHQALPKSIPHLNSSISLKYLDLKENGLRSAIAHCAMGKVSNSWGKFQSLVLLNLAKNSFSGKVPNSFGTLRKIGVCIRDDTDTFVLAKTEWFTPVCKVHVGKALGLLSAMERVHQLHLGPIDFEFDAKKVMDI